MSALGLEQLSPYLIPARQLETKRGHVPTLWPELNQILGGGWPRGALSEVCGPRSSGCTTVVYASLSAALQRGATVALVDAEAALDAQRVERAGIPLRQLLWVCARSQALKAAELLVSAGGFELVALDLGDSMPRLPMAAWIRLRQAAERQGTAVLLAARTPLAGSCSALSVRLRQQQVDFGVRGDFLPPLLTALSSLVSLERGHRLSGAAVRDCSLVLCRHGRTDAGSVEGA